MIINEFVYASKFPLALEYHFMMALHGSAKIVFTRNYPLRGYILGVLTHTTAWDQLWGGDGTLNMWF